jgi:hypothetical protein
MPIASSNLNYIFVEGDSDYLFMERVICPVKQVSFNIYDYAQKIGKAKKIISMIQRSNGKYVFTHDSDGRPDVNHLKLKLKRRFCLNNTDNISIVVLEIESWLIAGMTPESRIALKGDSLKLSQWRRPETINKEAFATIAAKNRLNKLAFEQRCLDSFDYDSAITRSESFREFTNLFEAIF